MFSLLLAIIISASMTRNSLADPIIQTPLDYGMYGLGFNGFYSSPSYGYGTRYSSYGSPMLNPEYSYLTNQHGNSEYPWDDYIPRSFSPFSHLYSTSRYSYTPSYSDRMYTARPNVIRWPHASFYKTDGSMITAPSPSSQYSTDRYSQPAYSRNVEIHNIFNTSQTNTKNTHTNNSLNLDTILAGNKSTKSLALENENGAGILESTNKRARGVQMTFLGYMPSSALRTATENSFKRTSNAVNQLGVPFYPLRIDNESSQRSASSPSVLISPYRLGYNQLNQNLNNYHQTSFSSIRPVNPTFTTASHNIDSSHFRPIISPYSGVHLPTSTTTHYSGIPSTPVVVSPFRSNSGESLDSPLLSTTNPFRSSTNQKNQNGYYLFDIQPLDPFDSGSKSLLGLAGPKEAGSTNVKPLLKSARQNYVSGFEKIPHGPTYPIFYSNRRPFTQQNDRNDVNLFNSGRPLIIRPFGSSEMRQLVGRLLTLRRVSMFKTR